ncbi:TIGR02206 family membrane protein [Roseibacillus persicicus]|uniref:YwaF family protein n=1 Tax=Roseibacillus persicicus TaxID=454148 RepID=UPI00280F6A8B|nr:TIGR02206 family membrane protein [Roseibacillus persicicus]MDQ8192584.1 TIGR02206 family membrane protein [Roseibacillus persicicus]
MPFLLASKFTLGSTSHGLALLFGLAVLVVAIIAQRRAPEGKLARRAVWVIILANLTSVFHTSASHYFSGRVTDLNHVLPLHLCDLTSLVAAAALYSRKPLLCELTYYLGLGGTLQGLITPNLHYDFPHPTYFSFFQLHLFVVIAALFLPLGMGWKPRRPLLRTTAKVFGIICGYLLTVFAINSALGTNYAFVMHKPENPSLYDHLGPHPWYLLSVLGLVVVMLALLSVPFLRTSSKK